MITDASRVYSVFHPPGSIVEIRALGVGGKATAWDGWATRDGGVFGYFDNPDAFAAAVKALSSLTGDRAPDGIYFTPNPPKAELLARAVNRMVAAGKKRPATNDRDIALVRWLLVDIDPKRPAGIGSSQEQLDHAAAAGKAIKQWMTGEILGFSEPVKGLSGNGYHLCFRVSDQSNEIPVGAHRSEASETIRKCLLALQARFNTDAIDIDAKVFNAARIWKLYGTWARKGDSTAERPHRQSFLFSDAPQQFDAVPVTPWEKVMALAAMAPEADKPAAAAPPALRPQPQPGRDGGRRVNSYRLRVRDYLDHFGIEVKAEDREGTKTKYILRRCLFNPDHTEAAIYQADSGALTYTCWHNSCSSMRWEDARAVISGAEKLNRWCDIEMSEDRPAKRTQKVKGDPEGGAHSITPISDSFLDCLEAGCEAKELDGNEGVPRPCQIDPNEFFAPRGSSGRALFVPERMVRYITAYLSPICCTDGRFWRYSRGVWRLIKHAALKMTMKQALKSWSHENYIQQAVTLLEYHVFLEEDDWPQTEHLINCRNGMIDLRRYDPAQPDSIDSILIPHHPKYGSRVQVETEYQPDAFSDLWQRTLWDIFNDGRDPRRPLEYCPGDDKIRLVQQYCGYIPMPTTKWEVAMFFFGSGANGKGTISDSIIKVLGERNVTDLNIESLGQRFSVPVLQQKMLVTSAELSYRAGSGVDTLKKCITGDMVSGEVKFGEHVEFRNTAKFLFSMNNPPGIRDQSHGFRRKFLLTHFTRQFETHEMDRNLKSKLEDRKPAIFNWMIQGALDLVSAGNFHASDALAAEKRAFEARLDPVTEWVEEACEVGDGDLFAVRTATFEAYKKWAEAANYGDIGRNNFYARLEGLLPKLTKGRKEMADGSKVWVYNGMALK